MSSIKLKPGLLVALSTRVEGGVQYQRKDLSAERAAEEAAGAVEGAAVEAWETVKVTEDPEEHGRAVKARGRARTLVTGVCISSPFGLLCPSAREAELDGAITLSRQVVDEFNATARTTRIDVWVLRGQIVESDTDAARGIAAEIQGLLAEMQSGIVARDADAIREAARKAKALGSMLEGAHAERVSRSVEIARTAAREIVRTISKCGDAALPLIADTKLAALRDAEQSFLDLDGPGEVAASVPVDASALDLGGEGNGEIREKVGIEESGDLDLGDVDATRAVDEDAASYATDPASGSPVDL